MLARTIARFLQVDLPWGGGSDEELGAIGVLSGVGHGEKTGLGVLQLEVLVCELVAVDYSESAFRCVYDCSSAVTYWTFLRYHRPW